MYLGSRLLGLLICAGCAHGAELRGLISDEDTGTALAGRVYISDAAGRWFTVRSAEPQGSSVVYAKTNWINHSSVEVHTTVSAHPFLADLPAGRYKVTVERGKEYFPLVREVEVGEAAQEVRFPLKRWVNMAAQGWYSGETHIHRTSGELQNILIAEDLNVAFPLSFWVTHAFHAPTNDIPEASDLIEADKTHVIWPRNTEYEIFSIGKHEHTLGALFLLNHKSVFNEGVPPWSPIAEQAKSEGALLDMDKLDWAFSFLLPPVTGAQLYELANNHMWRTEYAFTNYTSFAPPFLHPPYGAKVGNERDWTLYSFGMYYTLLNAGFRSVPTAGTASGVHPVPVGFSRVYVHLPTGFSYRNWMESLKAGRSFVTTGPMLLAQVNGSLPGQVFSKGGEFSVTGSITSEHNLSFVEILRNGEVVETIMPQNRTNQDGAFETSFQARLSINSSAWIAVRCWEDRENGRFRWAHTAPWHIEITGKPLLPTETQKEFLVDRMRKELARSDALLPPEAAAENLLALAAYEKLSARADNVDTKQGRPPKNDHELREWLKNMIWEHGFAMNEVRTATGLSEAEIRSAQKRFGIYETNRPAAIGLRIMPYPGGRHPRRGFLEGAINPQRDTKFTAFTPWDPHSYVVVDVPEAIWSDLGLTYLAHEHVETIWSREDTKLDPVEWRRGEDGSLAFERKLPNGIKFGSKVRVLNDSIRMNFWLHNGTEKALSGIRLQNCVMLMAAQGFHDQTGTNKRFKAPYAACSSGQSSRWIITAWDPLDSVWQNPPVPCMHSNPRLPDCGPGATVHAKGWLSFFVGENLDAELARIEATGWRTEILK